MKRSVRDLTIGSLFSGVGGLELGLEGAGLGQVLWQVELDPFCRAVLAKHWPNTRRHDDVKAINGNELEPVDLICGGFPCTDISNAGKRAGIDGKHSGLWSEMARIVRLVRPRFVVVENVAALLARGLERVLGDLASCGYDAEWDCVPASAVGAPHQRDRLFVLAWLVSDTQRDGSGLQPERFLRHQAERWDAHVAYVREALADSDPAEWRTDIARGNIADGRRSGRKETPSGPWADGSEVADTHGEVGRSDTRHAVTGAGDGPHGIGADESGRRGVGAWPPGPDDLLAWGRVPALSQPSFCRLADGLPPGLVRGRRNALKAYGNAVVPAIAEAIGRRVIELARTVLEPRGAV